MVNRKWIFVFLLLATTGTAIVAPKLVRRFFYTAEPNEFGSGQGAAVNLTATSTPGGDSGTSSQVFDSGIRNWLDAWAMPSHGIEATPSELAQLRTLLARTSLESKALFSLAHGFHSAYKNPVVSMLLYKAAANHAHKELTENSLSLSDKKEILASIKTNHEDLKDVVWPLIEERQDAVALDTLYTVYADFVEYTPKSGTPGYDRRLWDKVQTIRTGLAECLYLKGQMEEALVVIEENSTENLSVARRASLEWIWGTVLFRKDQFEVAIPHLQHAADAPSLKQAKVASSRLITALAKAGRTEEAIERLNAHVQKYGTDQEIKESMMKMIIAFKKPSKGLSEVR